ncbi:MAG: biosynthetic peptidoglycan transglycosylase, partial [Vagococcus sp.]
MTKPNDFNEESLPSVTSSTENLPVETNKNDSDTTNDHKNKAIFTFNVVYRVMRSLFLIGILAISALGFLGVGLGLGYFASLVSDVKVPTKEELTQKINDVEQQSKILYAEGELVSVIKSDLIRTSVKSEDISPLIKQALVATEDENFYDHKGIVPKALIRATISDVTGLGGSSGGSTITQQIIKQQVLTSETSYKRKASEIVLALRTEKFFSKEELLTSYLNVSPFGRNNRGENIAGIEEAAMGIFGVHAKDVTLPQAAFLAGLPQSPINYTPYTNLGEFKKNFDAGLKRKDDVLFNMYRE